MRESGCYDLVGLGLTKRKGATEESLDVVKKKSLCFGKRITLTLTQPMSTSVPTTQFQASSLKKIRILPPSKQIPSSNQIQHPQLELAIFTRKVGLYPPPPVHITTDELAQATMNMIDPPNVSSLTRLLSGPLADFESFSREEHSKWLIDIAHDICDPLQKRGHLKVWSVSEGDWMDVTSTDPLIASLYVYLIRDVVALTKVSARIGRSITDATGNPSTMANRVNDRDGRRCWLTRSLHPISNSHIIPKRMGDHILRLTYGTFVQTPPPPTLSIYDELCGITLCPNLDRLYDTYELGLRHVALVRKPSLLIFYH